MMEKIIFYIQTSTMISYFVVPIVQILKKNYEVHVLHIDSINDCKEPREFQSIIKHDIGRMTPKEIMCLLDKIQPKCVILINIYSLFELLILRLAKHQGYKTIFLQHGIFELNAEKRRYDKFVKKTLTEIKKLSHFCIKYACYIAQSGDVLTECKIFHNAFIKRKYSQTKFDAAIFFSPYWAHLMNEKLGLDEKQLEYSGYPLTSTNHEFDELLVTKVRKINKAILIHQPFIKDKLTTFTYEDELEYMKRISKLLSSKGIEVDLLLHPREDFKLYKNMYKDSGITIIQNIEKKEYAKYQIAIGFYSTALFIPIFLHIPIWIVDYDKILAKNSIFYQLSVKMGESISYVSAREIENFIHDKIGITKCSSENIAIKIIDCINKH